MTDYILDRLTVAVGTQYLVDAEIGRGGMAVVYRATDLRLHRRVAIKVLPPELAFNADVRERFLREAQTSAQLTHQNIVPIYTVDEREGLVYFVMALVEGETLGQRLLREPRLPLAQVRAILMDVADALAYAHAHGVVHRDVKPDNIMLDRATGHALVTDFGIARAAAGDSRLTVTGVAIGTPAYMSPEQALGERELDGRSDIYSLGVIGYQLLAGEPPFKAANTPAMLVKHVSEMPQPLLSRRPDAPPALAHAISRALAKKPEDRWPDAGAFRDALAGVREAPPYEDRPPAQRAQSDYSSAAAPAPSYRDERWDNGGRASAPASPLLPMVPPMPPPPA
ncbi:MAG: protein kinase, partial [Gemmatimonadetes bacterium]|nr:protein kinase [Gemmatimonadota bacterium]